MPKCGYRHIDWVTKPSMGTAHAFTLHLFAPGMTVQVRPVAIDAAGNRTEGAVTQLVTEPLLFLPPPVRVPRS